MISILGRSEFALRKFSAAARLRIDGLTAAPSAMGPPAKGPHPRATASATRMPSTAADTIPPA